MSKLFIDIGNTTVKWLFDGDYQSVSASEFSLDILPNAEQVFVSCVGDASLLKGLEGMIFAKSCASFNGFKSSYLKPETLGVDRFLAMIGAMHYYPEQDLLIIDSGSALTFDLVLANGEHQGGLIAPGLAKLRSSFEQFSNDSQQIILKNIASNTEDAWQFGTSQMLMNMINTQIEQHQESLGGLNIILTGGNAKMIALRTKHQMQLEQNLILDGLELYAQTYLG